jgi:hypothetical protein
MQGGQLAREALRPAAMPRPRRRWAFRPTNNGPAHHCRPDFFFRPPSALAAAAAEPCLPTQPTLADLCVVLLGSSCTFSRHHWPSIGAATTLQWAPAGARRSPTAKARRSRCRPGQPFHPTQVRLLVLHGRTPEPIRHCFGRRQQPLRRQGSSCEDWILVREFCIKQGPLCNFGKIC